MTKFLKFPLGWKLKSFTRPSAMTCSLTTSLYRSINSSWASAGTVSTSAQTPFWPDKVAIHDVFAPTLPISAVNVFDMAAFSQLLIVTTERRWCNVAKKHNRVHASCQQTIRQHSSWSTDWVLHPTWHKIDHFGHIPKPMSWLGMEKQNLTQRKHAFTDQNKMYNTQ